MKKDYIITVLWQNNNRVKKKAAEPGYTIDSWRRGKNRGGKKREQPIAVIINWACACRSSERLFSVFPACSKRQAAAMTGRAFIISSRQLIFLDIYTRLVVSSTNRKPLQPASHKRYVLYFSPTFVPSSPPFTPLSPCCDCSNRWVWVDEIPVGVDFRVFTERDTFCISGVHNGHKGMSSCIKVWCHPVECHAVTSVHNRPCTDDIRWSVWFGI